MSRLTITIIGVMQDFNFQSLRDPVTPLVMLSREAFGGQGVGFIYIRIKQNELATAVPAIQDKWNTLTNGKPFQFQFLDESLNAQYDAEKRAGRSSAYSLLLPL